MRRLLLVNVAACALLIVQYLLGMAVNVFVVIAAQHPGANAGDYFSGAASGLGWVIASGPGWAAAHAAFGLALVVAAIAAVALARGHGRMAVSLPVIGALAVIGAAFNGVSFVNYGRPFSSMIMAGLWALALACYVAGAIRAAMGAAGAAPERNLLLEGP
ncbi:MAG: hypothetical protein ACRDNO_23120 [Trebonia sp.]